MANKGIITIHSLSDKKNNFPLCRSYKQLLQQIWSFLLKISLVKLNKSAKKFAKKCSHELNKSLMENFIFFVQ